MKKIKIGVTCHPDTNKIFLNGNYQNALSLLGMLEKHKDFEVFPVAPAKEIEKIKGASKNKFLSFGDTIAKKIDILLCPIWSPTGELQQKLIKGGVKVVSITYGNIFAIISNEILNDGVQVNKYFKDYDEKTISWISPHYSDQLEMKQLIVGSELETEICPYIWNPVFLQSQIKNVKTFFKDHKYKKNVAIYEPNLNYTKTLVCPTLSISHYADTYSVLKDQKFYFYGVRSKSMEEKVSNFFESVKGIGPENIILKKRSPIREILQNSAITLSHQKDNSLNYTTLECLYLGLPVVHNSDHIEAGYKYEGLNVIEASKKLKEAMNHMDNLEEYNSAAEEEIYKYSPNNPKNIQDYIDLIMRAMDTNS